MRTPRAAALWLWIPIGLSVATSDWPRTEFLWVGLVFTVVVFLAFFLFGRWMRPHLPYGHFFRWFWFWVVVSLAGVWTAAHHKSPHESAHLGGWFTGHGGLVASIAGATTRDYSLLSRTYSVAVVALNDAGTLAATMSDSEFMIWDISKESPLCMATRPGTGSYALEWVGDTVFMVEHLRHQSENKANLIRFPVAAIQEGDCGSLPAVEITGRVAHCADGHRFLVAQSDGQGIHVRPIQRNPMEVTTADGFDLEAAPLVTVPEPTSSATKWGFAPGCNWLFRWDWNQASFDAEVSGSTMAGQRIRVASGSAGEAFSMFARHDRYIGISQVAFSADGTVVGAIAKGEIAIHDLGTGKTVNRSDFIRDEALYGVHPKLRFAPDGTVVATSARSSRINADPGVIAILAPGTLETLHELTGHGDSIRDIDLSKDGRMLVTGSRDQTARVWRLPNHGGPLAEESR